MSWNISPAVTSVQLIATLALANAGPGNSVLNLFTSPKPTPGAAPGIAAQVVIELANPCAQLIAGTWRLIPKNVEGSMVLETGVPLWARWLAASGEWLGDATVSDPTGSGGVKVSGGATAPGNTSPTLYAGGLALLGLISLS